MKMSVNKCKNCGDTVVGTVNVFYDGSSEFICVICTHFEFEEVSNTQKTE
jgi:ribosome-binding protein aMBF1 (putative translation factor)